jgi:hypothetical protein
MALRGAQHVWKGRTMVTGRDAWEPLSAQCGGCHPGKCLWLASGATLRPLCPYFGMTLRAGGVDGSTGLTRPDRSGAPWC